MHTPLREKRVKRPNQPDWFNDVIKQEILKRDLFLKSGNTLAYRKQRNFVVSLINSTKEGSFRQKFIKCKGNSGKLWQELRNVTGTSYESIKPASILHKGKTISDPVVIADIFNSYFVHVADSLLEHFPDQSDYVPSPQLDAFIKSKLPPDIKFSIPYMTVTSTLKAIRNIDHKKACGVDEIHSLLLKKSANIVAPVLCRIFNNSIRNGIFPDLWKHSRIIPLHKGGPKNNPDNFRPISILCTISKIFERHVHDALFDHLSKYKLLSDCQSGFMKFHSCQTALTDLMNHWCSCLDQGSIVGALNVDLRKAFNLINHDILISKLKIYGCSSLATNWFHSYLHSRKQYVLFNSKMSSVEICNYGVPQGSILGPLLFILYINDMPLHLDHCLSRMYADDTTLYQFSNSLTHLEYVKFVIMVQYK